MYMIDFILFYLFSINRFKKETQARFGREGKFNALSCETMLEDMDAQALQYYSMGDFYRALSTMQRAIKIRSETRIDFDSRTVALNLEFMADVYTQERKWMCAYRTYQQATTVLQKRISTQGESVDVMQLMKTLNQKINFVRSKFTSNEANLLDV
jgi:hypothetical protein